MNKIVTEYNLTLDGEAIEVYIMSMFTCLKKLDRQAETMKKDGGM